MATTIRQVATAAGVSVATASRALAGSDAVTASTRMRVVQVASDLDYTPSRLGRSLATGSTGNVGVILPDVTNPFYTTFLAELESALGTRDIGILVGDSHESLDLERALIARMVTQVDALVLASSRLADSDVITAAERLPVVLANRMLAPGTPAPARLTQIALDVDPGFNEAVRLLHRLGHREIVYADGPPQSWSGLRKREALARECGALGIRLTIVGTTRPDFSGGRDALRQIDTSTVTAIVAFNDQVALGVLAGLRERGVVVPGQVSVVGCDDSLPDGLAWPSLTTVDSSSRTLGALTAAAVIEISAPGARGLTTGTVQTRLVIRDSTGPAWPGIPRPTEERAARTTMTATTAPTTTTTTEPEESP